MDRLFSSLFGRILVILLAGLAAAYGLSYLAVMQERRQLVDGMMSSYAARDLASSLAILERLPAAERAVWLERLSRPNYQFTLEAPSGGEAVPASSPLTRGLVAALGPDRLQEFQALPGGDWAAALRLVDGGMVHLRLQPPMRGVSARTAGLLFLQLTLVGACTGWAVRQITRPLARLEAAARQLGHEPGLVRPLAEDGPSEVRQAAAAFNVMQRRIVEQMRERLQILAAVSHDLQTPITRMRVRTDMLHDPVARERLQADLSEMQRLVEEGLAYARSAHAAQEPPQPVDLRALLDTLVCDQQDMGHAAVLEAGPGVALVTRPLALRRIVSNLLDNAVKYAGGARVDATVRGDWVHVCVLDEGPGIPSDRLAEMKQPFRRLEDSRSRDSGGSGLGLAIAEQLCRALGARLVLENRADRGLEARVELPAAAQHEATCTALPARNDIAASDAAGGEPGGAGAPLSARR